VWFLQLFFSDGFMLVYVDARFYVCVSSSKPVLDDKARWVFVCPFLKALPYKYMYISFGSFLVAAVNFYCFLTLVTLICASWWYHVLLCLRQGKMAAGDITFLGCTFVCCRTCDHNILKMNQPFFVAYWHKWSAGQGHETVNFESQRSRSHEA